jgi:hypothetical protein
MSTRTWQQSGSTSRATVVRGRFPSPSQIAEQAARARDVERTCPGTWEETQPGHNRRQLAGGAGRYGEEATLLALAGDGANVVRSRTGAVRAHGSHHSLIAECLSPPSSRKSGSQLTRCWRKQSRANSSLQAQFPVMQGKYREFHRLWLDDRNFLSESAMKVNPLRANSLRDGTGN